MKIEILILYREFRGAWFSTVNNMDWPLER